VTGKTGGLIVHVGCGDGKLAAVLHASESYPVHGLDTDADEVNDEDRCCTTP
jgi:2-polyprenyl-3-methyl-5-hydroxy-6-metoxy-1,4-benzoquinol methylase